MSAVPSSPIALCYGPATDVIGQAVVKKLQRNSLSHAALRLHDSQHSRNTNTLYIYCYYYLNINMIFIYLSYCTVYRVGGRTSRKGHKWQVPVCVNLTRSLTEASGSQLIYTAQNNKTIQVYQSASLYILELTHLAHLVNVCMSPAQHGELRGSLSSPSQPTLLHNIAFQFEYRRCLLRVHT